MVFALTAASGFSRYRGKTLADRSFKTRQHLAGNLFPKQGSNLRMLGCFEKQFLEKMGVPRRKGKVTLVTPWEKGGVVVKRETNIQCGVDSAYLVLRVG